MLINLLIVVLILVSAVKVKCEPLPVSSSTRCDALDIPDAPMRAFRQSDGSIRAFATHYRNRSLIGTSLDSLARDCSVAYEGSLDTDPLHHDYKTWIAATWLSDEGEVYALGHNEYQAHEIPGACAFVDYRSCWYNSIVLLKSHDSGKTFHRVSGKAQGVVIAPDFSSMEGQGHPRGFTSPTNIVRWKNYLYALVGFSGLNERDTGRCVLRTSLDISLDSWSVLTDDGFVAPVRAISRERRRAPCLKIQGINGFVGSVSRLAGTDLFVAAAAEDVGFGGQIVAYYSQDLVRWRYRQVLAQLPLFWSGKCDSGHRYSYPSLLDDKSSSVNFDVIGLDPTLFLSRSDCRVGLNRALTRVSVHLSPPERWAE